ncbi:fimbrial protein YehD [Pseudescherichia sp.]|uniref:fimbrial protein YehD n=1 Tax=Pseudescherichia sp. TaxID=2055881 RepID=UPI00289AC084|nr:fimbrial protein YehD [Pseudescherichia sp.]
MKKLLIVTAVLATSIAAPAVFAADTDMGTLTINGLIKGTTCHFLSTAQTAHIPMNQIGLDAMDDLTPGKAYDGYQNKTTTSFKVKCAPGTEIPKLKFLADQFAVKGEDSVTKIEQGEGKATGVGYALLINGKRIDTNGNTTIATSKNDEGEYTFDISAQYARASDEALKAGAVDSTVTLTVVAD